jgi:RNA polymerase sigma-70 factor (ECF subfamily)
LAHKEDGNVGERSVTAKQQTDEWLMVQVADGQRHYLEILVRRYATPLLSYLTRWTGDPHRAEELVQEAFLAVWSKRRTFNERLKFRPWLYAIAVNCTRASHRPLKFRPLASLDELPRLEPLASEGTPVELALKRETCLRVEAAVSRLPDSYRRIVILRVWSGLPYAEIARVLDCHETTVRSGMHRALAELRRHLARFITDY